MKKKMIVAAAIVAIAVLGLIVSREMTDFVSDPQAIREWIRDTGIWGVLAFAGMNMIQVMLAVVPGGPFTLTAGFVFGPVRGTMLCVLSCTIASTIVFLLVHRFGMKLVSVFVSEKQLALLENYDKSPANAKRIERLMILIFIVPGTPKDPLNYMAGLTKIPVWVWFLTNLFGRIPGAYLSALGGSAFGSGKYAALIAAVGGLFALFVIGKVLHGIIENENEEQMDSQQFSEAVEQDKR